MFVAIYEFRLKSVDETTTFKRAWKGITELMLAHCNSLGSRLHKADEVTYIAYAQWPDREHWEQAGHKLPDAVNNLREQMRGACQSVKTLHELVAEPGHDLLVVN